MISLIQKRAFSHQNLRSGVFKEKTTKEVWLGDTGAYPIMGVILFAGCMSIAASFWIGAGPDSRLAKSDRKNPFRGALKEEFAKENKAAH